MPHLDKNAHALHNYLVCHFLNKSEMDCNDWIVTTAFYSSIHYCETGLFPADYYINPTTKELNYFASFQDFHRAFQQSSKERVHSSPHSSRRWLINSQVDEIAEEYVMLADICYTARYKNYRIKPEETNECVKYLENIKSFCE